MLIILARWNEWGNTKILFLFYFQASEELEDRESLAAMAASGQVKPLTYSDDKL
jgi:hypothetical protein